MESLAYRSLFLPICYLSVILSGFLFCLILGGLEYIVVGFKPFSFLIIPYILLFILKIRKPKVLFSKNKAEFVIHYNSKNVSIPFNEIQKISFDSLYFSSMIIIKTNFKKYRIRDVKDVYNVYKSMFSIFYDNKN